MAYELKDVSYDPFATGAMGNSFPESDVRIDPPEESSFSAVDVDHDPFAGAKPDGTSPSDVSERSGDFWPGVKSGYNSLKAMGGGAVALGADLVGADSLQDWGMETYKKYSEKAAQDPNKHSFKDVYTGKAGIGGAMDWMEYTLGSLVPSMAEAAVGAIAGTLVAPGPGSVAGGLATRTLLKKGIKKLTKEAVEAQIEKGIKKGIIKKGAEKAAREGIESKIEREVTKQALKKFGGKIGMGAAVLPMEAGGNYAELLEEHGIEAPFLSLATGAAATAAEFVLGMQGNAKLIDGFVDAFAKKNPIKLKSIAKSIQDAVVGMPAEGAQEAWQEFMSIVNTVAVTDEKLLTAENFDRMAESFGAGAVGGGAGGAGGVGINLLPREQSGKKDVDPAIPVDDISPDVPTDTGVVHGPKNILQDDYQEIEDEIKTLLPCNLKST